jgi:hypothetical protein
MRFFCASSALYGLSKNPEATFWRSVHVEISSEAQEAQVAGWLAARKGAVHHLGLFHRTSAGSDGSTLRCLAGGALTALDWGIYCPGRFEVGDLHLPHLRRLRIRITQGAGRDILTLAPDLSRLSALEQLRVDEGWAQGLLSPGCLPSSLTNLYLGPSHGTGYLPEPITTATQLRQLRLLVPQPAGSLVRRFGLSCLGRLTRLELWQGKLYEDLACLTSLESLALLNLSCGFGQLSVLQPLQRLTGLSIGIPSRARSNIIYGLDELPNELAALTALRELAILTGPIVILDERRFFAPLASLARLTKLVMPGVLLKEFPPDLRRQLTALRELDLGR